jgi:antitoxin component of RelBE/YafQ-DinJ toxin-antitoxin module
MNEKSDTVMLSIRVPKDLKKAFSDVCEANNQAVSKVIKSFMNDYVKKATEQSQKE